MNNNNRKRFNLYTQVQRLAARGLLIVGLCFSGRLESVLAVSDGKRAINFFSIASWATFGALLWGKPCDSYKTPVAMKPLRRLAEELDYECVFSTDTHCDLSQKVNCDDLKKEGLEAFFMKCPGLVFSQYKIDPFFTVEAPLSKLYIHMRDILIEVYKSSKKCMEFHFEITVPKNRCDRCSVAVPPVNAEDRVTTSDEYKHYVYCLYQSMHQLIDKCPPDNSFEHIFISWKKPPEDHEYDLVEYLIDITQPGKTKEKDFYSNWNYDLLSGNKTAMLSTEIIDRQIPIPIDTVTKNLFSCPT